MTGVQKYVWEGAIPLQIHLHESEVTTLPPPALIMAPLVGYLPLLISLVKPHFSSALPPGVDTIWFEYKGLPLKWYIPTGVLFDLLCTEPERPWNLTAAYIINGNCKNVMNMSQPDQVKLWRSVLNSGNLESYQRVSSKLKLGNFEDYYMGSFNSSPEKSQQSAGETDMPAEVKIGRIPVRLYLWTVREDFGDAPQIDSWDKVSYINLPVEIHKKEGKYLSLHDAVKILLPEFFPGSTFSNEEYASSERNFEGEENSCEPVLSCKAENAEIKLVRIQGIEPKLQIPFSWVVQNLMNPEHFLHMCVCLRIPLVSSSSSSTI